MRGYVEPEIDKHMTERAINYSKALSACKLDFSYKRYSFADNAEFRNYVLQSIRDFAMQNPGTWIILNLDFNNIYNTINDPTFFGHLMHDIRALVRELKIDIAGLSISHNELTRLPEDMFAGLSNLQVLLYVATILKFCQNVYLQASRICKNFICARIGYPNCQKVSLKGSHNCGSSILLQL